MKNDWDRNYGDLRCFKEYVYKDVSSTKFV